MLVASCAVLLGLFASVHAQAQDATEDLNAFFHSVNINPDLISSHAKSTLGGVLACAAFVASNSAEVVSPQSKSYVNETEVSQ